MSVPASHLSSPSPWAAIVERLRDAAGIFLLADALALARRLDPGAQADLAAQLALIAQKQASAEILAASDQVAEALTLAEEAVALVLQAAAEPALSAAIGAEPAAADDPRPSWAATLAGLGAGPGSIERLAAAQLAAQEPRPALNHAVTPALQERTRLALAAAKGAARRLMKLAQPPARVMARRRLRIGCAAALVLCAMAWIVVGQLDNGMIGITASASYDQTTHGPTKAVDGDPTTEWLLPSRAAGSLEVHLRPRRLHEVRLRNAHNAGYNDRATHGFHIECYREGKLVTKVAGSFAKFEAAPAWIKVPIDARNVDTLKIVVDSYHKSGGGLAEISWD
jgi:hypothetical protein